jgi:polynucleotide 5'-kinase involved in rRNA processing
MCFLSEFDKAEAPSSVKKARPRSPQQQQQQQQKLQNSRDERARKRNAVAEDYFPTASDL